MPQPQGVPDTVTTILVSPPAKTSSATICTRAAATTHERPRRCSAPAAAPPPPLLRPSLVPLLSFPPALLAWPYGSAQSLSRVRLSETPWTAARQASLSITNSRSLLRLLAIESVTPSNRPAFLAKQALFQELELQDLLSLPACAGAGLSRPASWVWRGE